MTHIHHSTKSICEIGNNQKDEAEVYILHFSPGGEMKKICFSIHSYIKIGEKMIFLKVGGEGGGK